jgi:hypothetical protein
MEAIDFMLEPTQIGILFPLFQMQAVRMCSNCSLHETKVSKLPIHISMGYAEGLEEKKQLDIVAWFKRYLNDTIKSLFGASCVHQPGVKP